MKNEVKKVESYKNIIPLSDLTKSTSDLIHELQKERGRTVGMISSQYQPKFVEALNEQRKLTHIALKTFELKNKNIDISKIYPYLYKEFQTNIAQLNNLANFRESIDNKKVSIRENIDYYSHKIDSLIKLLNQISIQTTPLELRSIQTPLINLIKAKENAGLERALGGALFNEVRQGGVSSERYLEYYKEFVLEQEYLENFNATALRKHQNLYNQTVAGPEVEQVIIWRTILAKILETQDGRNIDGKTWFDYATVRINKMKIVEDTMAQEAKQISIKKYKTTINKTRTFIGLYIALILLTIFIAIKAIRSINKSVAMEKYE